MTAFVIGAQGYIGRRLSAKCALQLPTIGTTSDGRAGTLALRLETPELFNYDVICANDIVFFAAAMSSPDRCSREHSQAWAMNVTGTKIVINNVISRGGRVVFFSSDTVYGNCIGETKETAICNPLGYYAEMKYEVERSFLGEPLFKSIRLSYVFSRSDKFTMYLLRCAERNEEAEIYDPFCRAVVHLDDVVGSALALAINWERYSQNTINVGGPKLLSRREFSDVIRSIAAHGLRYRVVAPDAEFFSTRPRFINMVSPVLTSLLAREPHSLFDAAKIEFGSEESQDHD